MTVTELVQKHEDKLIGAEITEERGEYKVIGVITKINLIKLDPEDLEDGARIEWVPKRIEHDFGGTFNADEEVSWYMEVESTDRIRWCSENEEKYIEGSTPWFDFSISPKKG